MHEILIEGADRSSIYEQLIPQIRALLQGENDAIANLANTAAALKQALGFLWVGCYLVRDQELVLGPFQGPVACTRIAFGRGVCGSAWQQRQTIIVPDVDRFPGHIACSSASRSEIVVPLLHDGEVVAVLDIDSDRLDDFSKVDQEALESIASLLTPFLRNP